MIRRSTLRAQLADALREEILAGRLRPGEEFTVREIAEQYGVSATPVREALVDLSAQGLLEIEQHRGFRIRQYSLTDFRQMVDARSLVSEGLLQLFPARRGRPDGATGHADGRADVADAFTSPDAFVPVRRRAAAARQAALAGDLDILIAYDLRFWRELGALLGNPYITEFLDRLRVRCWAFAVPFLRQEKRLAGRLWAGHLELTDAIERQDTAETERLLRAYRNQALRLAVELTGTERGPRI